jgi:hypothetical protein
MCLTLMWDQFWLGLEPQSLHFTIICCPGVVQISTQSFVSRGCWNVVRMHPYAHSLHMMVVKHLTCVWHWCGINLDWVYSLNHCTSPSFVAQELPRFLPKALSAGAAGILLGHIHMHIHRIWWLSNTLHVSDIDVGSILIGSTASITALHHHLLPRNYPDF